MLEQLPIAIHRLDVLIGHFEDAGQLASLALHDLADGVAGVDNLGQDFGVASGQALLNLV